MALGFIRYFCVTNDSPIGRIAQGYLVSLLRIAPVRVVSRSGGLDGSWRRFSALLLTPMDGPCTSCVCTHPSAWVSDMSVPMPATNVGAMGAARAESAPKVSGVARGVAELYTPPAPGKVLRNVLFVVEPPATDAQRKTAAKYEAVLFSSPDVVAKSDLVAAAAPGGDLRDGAYVDFVYQTLDHTKIDHEVIRKAVLGS